MSSRKRSNVPFISLVILLITCSSVCAATNWGTKGVSDTSKVTNVVQLTTDATATGLGKSYLMGDTWPEGSTDNVQPWRKDGAWIAFTAEVGGTGTSFYEICKIKPDGSSFTQLTNNSVKDSNASFSTDSKIYNNVNNLSAVSPTYMDRVWRMDENGAGRTDLSAVHSVADTDNEKAVVVSPDGSKIAFLVGSLLTVANSDGTSPVRVSGTYNAGASNISVAAGQYSWSPDSQWLVYSGYETTGYFLYKVKSDSTLHTQLTSVGADLGSLSHLWPVWSPDGSKIAYLWRQYTSNVIVPNYRNFYELRTISASDGTALKTLDMANDNMTVGWSELIAPASWSPDSIWLAYSKKWADTVSYKAILIVNTEDTTPTPSKLTTGFNDFFPIWAPNGSQLLFQSGYFQLSREDDTCSPSCTDRGDILLLNLIGDYGGGTTSSFPWPMFMPSIQKNGQQ